MKFILCKDMPIRIIACRVFQDALKYLAVQENRPKLRISYLRAGLHNHPLELNKALSREIRVARQEGDSILCLYGQCFPGIDDFLQKESVPRIAGAHCYEMFLGSNTFQQIMEEEAGTYFLEKKLLIHFGEYCVRPLELEDAELRKSYFRHYKRLLYIRQPLDPDLLDEARDVAQFLSLELSVVDADYAELQANLFKLFNDAASNGDS
jgi:hypothetical protein